MNACVDMAARRATAVVNRVLILCLYMLPLLLLSSDVAGLFFRTNE